MREYESVIIVKPEIIGEKLKEYIEKVNQKLSERVKITKIKDLGLKKLAYTVKQKEYGNYICHEFEITDNNDVKKIVKGIEKYFKTQEEIIKFIVVERC